MPDEAGRLLSRIRKAAAAAVRRLKKILAPRHLYRFTAVLSRGGCIDNRFFTAEVECTVKAGRSPSEAAGRAAAAALQAAGVRGLEVKVEPGELIGTVGEDVCRAVRIGELYDVWDYCFYFKYTSRERPSQNRKFEVRVTFWLNHGDDPEKWWGEAERIAFEYVEMFGITDLTGWEVWSSEGAEFKGTSTVKKDFDVEINDLYRADQGPWSREDIERIARERIMAERLGFWG